MERPGRDVAGNGAVEIRVAFQVGDGGRCDSIGIVSPVPAPGDPALLPPGEVCSIAWTIRETPVLPGWKARGWDGGNASPPAEVERWILSRDGDASVVKPRELLAAVKRVVPSDASSSLTITCYSTH